MSSGGKAFHLGAATAAFALVMSSTAAHAAPRSLTTIDPLVSLSVFGTSSSRAAVCAAGTASTATAATAAAVAARTTQQGPGAGCVLPVLGSAPPPAVVGAGPVVPVAAGGLGSIGGILPLFAILGLTALAVAYLENKKDNFPVSPF